ncbi:hypothetical protein BDN72DRAFT_502208 [Pluteus cervinus]|uniref:Uncharacterized protein n=1 Tax=Pluteus cervinus TaxID=181527 RepID=A0ACD3AZJ4_9AGAR|nr:hypothetical protein BDN72DRAFT_502208 [Pluteus cervinus]
MDDSNFIQPEAATFSTNLVSLSTNAFTRNFASAAALACLIYESVITFDDEWRYMWRRGIYRCRRPITVTKCIFFFTRYFAFAFQLSNQYLIAGPFGKSSVKESDCIHWFIFQTAGVQIQQWMVEIILLLRVCALYSHTSTIYIFLTFVFICQMGVVVFAMFRTFTSLAFNEYCIPKSTPPSILYFCLRTFFLQLLIGALTLAKRKTAVRDGWATTPILVLVTRDGAWVFVAVSVVNIIISLYCLLVHSVVQIIFSWPFTIATILACRLILNMQKLQPNTNSPTSSNPSSPVLTSDFDVATRITNTLNISNSLLDLASDTRAFGNSSQANGSIPRS